MSTAPIARPGRRLLRHGLALAVALCAFSLSACEWDGNFTLLGYTTRPNYDEHIHTVYVPIFKNLTFYRGVEFDLTRAVVREIEAKTPFKVISDRDKADTELSGVITIIVKNILNRNQLNEVREAEEVITVQVVWKDLHTGEILSAPLRPNEPAPGLLPGGVPVLGAPVGTPLNPLTTSPPTRPLSVETPAAGNSADTLPPPTPLPGAVPGTVPPPCAVPVLPPPVTIQATGTFVPEIGGSLTWASKQAIDRLAIQIVSMMEKPW